MTIQETIKDRIGELGEEVDKVTLQVDYQIIEHFSQNLYDSPNKAIEELVANSFDAFATHVRVFTIGPYTSTRILVWDNGESMDIDGLKRLWWIARSPKSNGVRETQQDGRTRKIIGKFGIGKLASYSVGDVISHLCRHKNEFYLVCVDYGDMRGNGRQAVSSSNPIHAPILKLGRDEAFRLVKALFDKEPASLEEVFEEGSWTLAIIEALKVDGLPAGRLSWVIGNGMPLRPDFRVDVNEENVVSKLDKQADVIWNFGSAQVVNAIKARWQESDVAKDGSGYPTFSSETGLDPARPSEVIHFVTLQGLGKVWGTIRLFDETLVKYRANDHGRSHGFFLYIRGRLINPDDEKLFHPDPSFQTFFRSQFIINADDLDGDLLADRQGLRDGESTNQLRLLQEAVGRAARFMVEKRDEEQVDEQSAASILPVASRAFYRDPLNALILDAPLDEQCSFDPSNVGVEREPLGSDRPISEFAFDRGAFVVNASHPYYEVLQKRAGQSRAAREFLRTFDLFAISERLLEGHLIDLGIVRSTVDEVMRWRDGLFRRLAASYEEAPELIQDMVRTSYMGGRPFEVALEGVFEDMGFSARHDGGSGREDVRVLATVGRESYSFTLEAKGSRNGVSNRDAAVGAAANHRDLARADHAIIVARKFAGFGGSGDDESAALFKECESTGRVSFMELDAIDKLYRAIVKYSYPLPLLKSVFLSLDTPASKLDRIEALAKPEQGFDYESLLESIWRRQGKEAQGDPVSYRAVHQQDGWKGDMEFDEFECRLVALDTLASGRIRLDKTHREVYLRQSPELILDQIGKSLHGEGHDIGEAP